MCTASAPTSSFSLSLRAISRARLDDTCPYQHIPVFIRQRQHSGQLPKLGNTDFLAYLDLLQRHKLLYRVVHCIGTDQQFFALPAGNLPGALRFLLRAHPLVLLQLAQFIGQLIGFALHLLRQRPRLGTGGLQLIFTLLDQFVPFFTGGFQLAGCLIAQPLDLILALLELLIRSSFCSWRNSSVSS